jgi:hypothetical protein
VANITYLHVLGDSSRLRGPYSHNVCHWVNENFSVAYLAGERGFADEPNHRVDLRPAQRQQTLRLARCELPSTAVTSVWNDYDRPKNHDVKL